MRLATVALIVSSILMEWLFLTGTPLSGRALADAFSGFNSKTPAPVVYTRPNFQAGMAFPRWGQDSYTPSDPNYRIGLDEIRQQTAARWIELTIFLTQPYAQSTTVSADPLSATPDSLAAGIAAAHAHGYKVFVEPLLSLQHPTPHGSLWSGSVNFGSDYAATADWFQSYWQALQPYLLAAQSAGADQFAVGAELFDLEIFAPSSDWNWLIEQARSAYTGRLTYDVNFTSLVLSARNWMTSPLLDALGVSLYVSIAKRNEQVALGSIPERWAATAGAELDLFARQVNHPLIITEVGYRNAADAAYNPFTHTTEASPDPQLQAALYSAAVSYAESDAHIIGVYFWAWSLPPFSPNWLPAAQTLKRWYTSPLA
jgi:hypothetical protein